MCNIVACFIAGLVGAFLIVVVIIWINWRVEKDNRRIAREIREEAEQHHE